MKKFDGIPQPKKVGINKVSTFNGFCSKHDNELFERIDNIPLIPDHEQIGLYAYRCLCREFFVKENALHILEKASSAQNIDEENRVLLENLSYGARIGFNWLATHKNYFDDALSKKYFPSFNYCCFISKSNFNLQLSGVLYPDFDFIGNEIQKLTESNSSPDLITFFTAPTSDGWAFVFAWHESSKIACEHLIRSLATKIHSGHDLEDELLRFSFLCCENHAFRISWWDSLNNQQQNELSTYVHHMIDPSKPVYNDYLVAGKSKIANWKFDTVYSEFGYA